MLTNAPASSVDCPARVVDLWRWADTHLDALRAVLVDHAPLLVDVRLASVDADQNHGRDVEYCGGVACRVRRRWFVDPAGRVHRDLTLRVRPNRDRSEWHKVKAGRCAPFYIVGASDNTPDADGRRGLVEWFVVDMSRFRECGLVHQPADRRVNGDAVTSFVAWSVDQLAAAGCVVVASWTTTTTARTWSRPVSTSSASEWRSDVQTRNTPNGQE